MTRVFRNDEEKTKAFYVRFQVPISKREAAPAEIDVFMEDFVVFLAGLGLGPTGDMSPAGSGVFLIVGIDPHAAGVIVHVKDTDPAAVGTWLHEKGVAHEVGKVIEIDIDPNTKPGKATP